MEIKGFSGDYRWLSNFWMVDIVYRGIKYTSTEAAYQAAKTNDMDIKRKIAKMSPAEAKKFGKTVKLREDWDDVKYEIMYNIQCLKYNNPNLKTLLCNTFPAHIEETNYWGDTYWGVCKGQGENNLGKILMSIRDQNLNN